MRSSEPTPLTASSRSPRSCSPGRSWPYESTFWPRSVTSRTPRSASNSTSLTMSGIDLLTSLPRLYGIMQKEQNLSQPWMIGT